MLPKSCHTAPFRNTTMQSPILVGQNADLCTYLPAPSFLGKKARRYVCCTLRLNVHRERNETGTFVFHPILVHDPYLAVGWAAFGKVQQLIRPPGLGNQSENNVVSDDVYLKYTPDECTIKVYVACTSFLLGINPQGVFFRPKLDRR